MSHDDPGRAAHHEPYTRLVMLARPGAGKTTQADRLAHHLRLTHLDTGALLRREVESSSPLGLTIASALEHGELAPDSAVMAVIGPGIDDAVSTGGYVLDGFPRHLAQAKALDAFEPASSRPQAALLLEVREEECRRRLLARASLEDRNDDTPPTIDRRLATYELEMLPVLEYYDNRGMLVRIDGDRPSELVTAQILDRLGH